MPKITRLRIKNFRGIEAREIDVPPTGVLVKGHNGAGKTSVLKAIRAALASTDVGVDAIRHGADEAEILVDLDVLSVRRAIRSNGNTSLSVRDPDGTVRPKPQTVLNDLLGNAAFDPLDFYLAAKKDRRRMLLEAMPISVTVERLRAWVPTLQDSYPCRGHGLEVLERLHADYYERRHEANAIAKRARDDADRARDAAEQASAGVDLSGPTIEQARQAERDAQAQIATLEARAAQARAAAERVDAARAQVAALRQRATEARALAATTVAEAQIDAAKSSLRDATARVDSLRQQLAAAERAQSDASTALIALERQAADARAAAARAADLDAQASAVETTIAAAVTGPTPAELQAAQDALVAAQLASFAADSATAARAAFEHATAQSALATDAETTAAALDKIVASLRDDAPRALFAEQNGIAGLAIEGDDILLDGVKLDGLCGAEQMGFAVEVARRANARAKILVVDGLERLDSTQLEHFVTAATRDDWQLIATRVADGDVVFEAVF